MVPDSELTGEKVSLKLEGPWKYQKKQVDDLVEKLE